MGEGEGGHSKRNLLSGLRHEHTSWAIVVQCRPILILGLKRVILSIRVERLIGELSTESAAGCFDAMPTRLNWLACFSGKDEMWYSGQEDQTHETRGEDSRTGHVRRCGSRERAD